MHFNYFGEFQMSQDRARKLYKGARKIHDVELIRRGQYGELGQYRCNFETFDLKLRKKISIETQSKLHSNILDRDTLYSLKPDERNARLIHGRQRWTQPKKYDPMDNVFLQSATITQMDTLCNGTQLRVRYN